MEVLSNPDDNESTKIISAVAIVTSIAVATVVPRLYVRVSMLRNLGWDDALIVLTMACAIIGLVLTVIQANHGAGKHRGDVQPDDYAYGMLINFINQPIYLFGICFAKLAVGAALIRIASRRSYRCSILGVMGFMLIYTIACFFTVILQCSDIRILWNPAVEATCWTTRTIKTLSYTNAALNIITDLLFSIAIPLPMLWKLHVNFRTRVTLMFILGIGVFACGAASIKVSYLRNYGKTNDLLWDSRNITIWTAAELNIAIIAASLPCLKPIFKKFLDDKYGVGSYEMSRKQNSGMRHQYFPSKFGRQSNGNTSESQTDLKHGDCQYLAHIDSTNLIEISSDVRSEPRDDVSSTVPDMGIVATTSTIVKFSEREARD